MANELATFSKDGFPKISPHRYQRRLLASKARITFYLKGWRAGYSSLAPFWMINEIRRCGPGNAALVYLAIAPQLQSTLRDEMVRVICTRMKLGRAYNAPRARIVLNRSGDLYFFGEIQPERTEIMFCHGDEPDSFAHYTALAIVGDEVGQKKFKYESYNVMLARVATTRTQLPVPNKFNQKPDMFGVDGWDKVPMGRILLGTTVYNLGWIETIFNKSVETVKQASKTMTRREFRSRWKRGTVDPVYNFIRSESTANPNITPEEMAEKKAASPDWFYQMRYRARFKKPAGAIFDGWDKRFIVKPFKIPSSWARSCAIDFGRKNFYAGFWAHDEERDRHFLYAIYHDKTLSNDARARALLQVQAAFEVDGAVFTVPPRIDFCVAGQISEDADRIELQKGGLVSQPPAFKDLWTGINTLAAAINRGNVFVFADTAALAAPLIPLQSFVDEVKDYTRPVDEMGNVDLDADPEEKRKFHLIDQARYYGTHRLVDVRTSIAVHGGRDDIMTAPVEQEGGRGAYIARLAGSAVPALLGAGDLRFLQ